MTAWVLNVILPGTGLIVRRRAWLGFCLALVFGMCGNAVLAGWLIAPAAVPGWLTRLALLLTGLAWVLSQVLLRRQCVLLRQRTDDLAALLAEARSALETGDAAAARLALESGAAMDDENVELYVLRARLCEMEGDDRGRLAAWRRVARLDRRKQYHEEIARARRGGSSHDRAG